MSSDIKTVNLTLAIPLRHLGNEARSIEAKLNGLISQYVPAADGVLTKWSDLTIEDKGTIIDDQPFVFWRVSFTAHTFKPIEGKLVRGRVQRLLKRYFLAIAMDAFTVTVSIPDEFSSNRIVQSLMVEQDVYFKIKGSSEGVYRGELDQESLDLIAELSNQEKSRAENVYEYAKDFEY